MDKKITDINELAQGKIILWGAASSMYSARIRTYLLKKGIPFVELRPSHPYYHDVLLPQIGYVTVPIVQFPSGEFIADSSEAILHFEKECPENPMVPESKPLAAIGWLIHSYGCEGLHKPSMHYRWNTTEENREFIIYEFDRWFASNEQLTRDANNENSKGVEFSKKMKDYLPVLGITDETVSVIESSAIKLYDALNAHFQQYPYLLGGRPSIADFGMMVALYGHLGRDPSSNSEVKHRSPSLYRWIETMMCSQIVDPEVWHVPQEYFKDTELPETLLNVLRLIGDDYVPEMKATIDTYHTWLKEVPDRPSGTYVSVVEDSGAHQLVGQIEHVQQGQLIRRTAMIDPVISLQGIANVVDEMDNDEKQLFNTILASTGCDALSDLRLERAVVRENYVHVLE